MTEPNALEKIRRKQDYALDFYEYMEGLTPMEQYEAMKAINEAIDKAYQKGRAA